MKYQFRFSVFTATRNRAGMLYQLYQDLKAQTYKDFEWVVVNDGSCDNTDEVIKSIQKEDVLHIQYVSLIGEGKHSAWRAATPLFRGRYVVTADDDDHITTDMLTVFDKHWKRLEQSSEYDVFWEVRSRCKKNDGSLVGKALPSKEYDSDYNTISYKMKVYCEMVGCRKVEVLRNEASVPEYFPFMKDASNFAEVIRWSRAARKYKTRFVSDVTRTYCETPESLSSNAFNRCMSGDKKIITNKMVEFYYVLLEQKDLLLKYDKRRYIKNLLGYSLLIGLYDNPYNVFGDLTFSQKNILRILIPLAKLAIRCKKKYEKYKQYNSNFT